MDKEKSIAYMQGIHDALPNAAMELLARDVMRFIGEQDTQEWIKTVEKLPEDEQEVIFYAASIHRQYNN